MTRISVELTIRADASAGTEARISVAVSVGLVTKRVIAECHAGVNTSGDDFADFVREIVSAPNENVRGMQEFCQG